MKTKLTGKNFTSTNCKLSFSAVRQTSQKENLTRPTAGISTDPEGRLAIRAGHVSMTSQLSEHSSAPARPSVATQSRRSTAKAMTEGKVFDSKFYCFRRCPTAKIHVIQMYPGRESRRFLKWLATVKSSLLGAPSAPVDGGYGHGDTHSKSFKFMRRDVLLNFGDNEVYEVPLQFRKMSNSNQNVNLCCDDSSGIVILCNSFSQINDILQFVGHLDESFHANASPETIRRPMLVFFTNWNNFFKYNVELYPEVKETPNSLFVQMLRRMGISIDENMGFCRLRSGAVAQFCIYPEAQEAYVVRTALECISRFAQLVISEISNQTFWRERHELEKFLNKTLKQTKSKDTTQKSNDSLTKESSDSESKDRDTSSPTSEVTDDGFQVRIQLIQ